jgi:hypothetical protein
MTTTAALETIASEMLRNGTYELSFRRVGDRVDVQVNGGGGLVPLTRAAELCGISRNTFRTRYLSGSRPRIRKYAGRIRMQDIQRIQAGEID